MTNTTIIICSLILLVIGILLERNSKIKKLETKYEIVHNNLISLQNEDWIFKHYNLVKNMTFKQKKLFFKTHPGYISDIDSMNNLELEEHIDLLLDRQKLNIDSFINEYNISENIKYKIKDIDGYTFTSSARDSLDLFDEFQHVIEHNIDKIKDQTITMPYKCAYSLYTTFNITGNDNVISKFIYNEETKKYKVTFCNKFSFEIEPVD